MDKSLIKRIIIGAIGVILMVVAVLGVIFKWEPQFKVNNAAPVIWVSPEKLAK